MQKRATSKKRAVDAEPKINMDKKEATPVEDEVILPPMEPAKPTREEQPEKPTQTGDVNFQETMIRMLNEIIEIQKEIRNDNKRWIEAMRNDRNQSME